MRVDEIMIKWRCNRCNKQLQAADERAGKQGKCPACNHVMPIPQTVPVESTPPVPKTSVVAETHIDPPPPIELPPAAPVSAAPGIIPAPILIDGEDDDLVEAVAIESVRFECPKCGITLKAPKAAVDSTITCPGCRAKVRVPDDEEPVASFAVDLRTGASTLRRGDEPALSPVVTQARLREIEGIASSGGFDPPLHLALTRGYDDVAEILIERGHDVNQRGFAGLTPLHYCCDVGALASLDAKRRLSRLLLKKGADPNASDDKGTTPLHRAAEHSGELAKLLVRHGAIVDHPAGATGKTPLHVAAGLGQRDVVAVLVELGADVTIKDHFGRTAAKEYQVYSEQFHMGAADPNTARLLRTR